MPTRVVSDIRLAEQPDAPAREGVSALAPDAGVSAPTMPIAAFAENPMEAYRRAQFAASVGMRLRAGGAPEAVLAQIAEEQRALAAALLDPGFVEAFVQALLAKQHAAVINPRYQFSEASARGAARDILEARAHDAQQFARLAEAPGFLAEAQAAPEPVAPSGTIELSPAKKEEMIERLVQATSPYGPQAVAHVESSMLGDLILHDALDAVFKPDGPLRGPLIDSVNRHLPNAGERATALVDQWLITREGPAHATTELLGQNGSVRNEALRRAAALRKQMRLQGNAPRDAHGPTTPAAAASAIAAIATAKAMSPEEREQRKTTGDKAEDWAYTLNHALSCGVTDLFIQPPMGAWVESNAHKWGWMRWIEHIFEKHEHHGPGHAHDTHCGHGHDHAPAKKAPSFGHNLQHWFVGEAAGDFGAVPLTIAVQRYFPGLTAGIRHLLEPLMGSTFRKSAHRDAQNWAQQNGMAIDSKEAQAKEEQLYEHEISHLPQAVVWNAFSIPINLGVQKYALKSTASWPTLIVGKVFGSVFSNFALIGTRAVAPEMVNEWDRAVSKHVIVPITQLGSGLEGADSEASRQAAERQKPHIHGNQPWAARMQAEEVEQAIAPDLARQ